MVTLFVWWNCIAAIGFLFHIVVCLHNALAYITYIYIYVCFAYDFSKSCKKKCDKSQVRYPWWGPCLSDLFHICCFPWAKAMWRGVWAENPIRDRSKLHLPGKQSLISAKMSPHPHILFVLRSNTRFLQLMKRACVFITLFSQALGFQLWFGNNSDTKMFTTQTVGVHKCLKLKVQLQ